MRESRFYTKPRWYDGDAIRLKGVEEIFRAGEGPTPTTEMWNRDTRTWEDMPTMGLEIYGGAPDLPDGGAERIGLDESNGLYGYVLDEANFDKVGDY